MPHLSLLMGEGWHVFCSSLWSVLIFLFSADNTGEEFAASDSGWDSLSIRHAFIRKVKHTFHTNHNELALVCVCRVLSLHLSHRAKRGTTGCNVPFCMHVFFRCIWFWRLSSLSPQPLWPYSHLCEYTECVLCACLYLRLRVSHC